MLFRSVAYNDIVDYIEDDDSWGDKIWRFKEILQHSKPLSSSSKDYKGSRFNVLILWEDGARTWEPLKNVWSTDPVTVAIYARRHNLLDTQGWKFPGIKQYAKTQKRILRRANQAKLQSFRTKPVYMYGVLVPRNYEQALELDKANGDTKWQDATTLELRQIDEVG